MKNETSCEKAMKKAAERDPPEAVAQVTRIAQVAQATQATQAPQVTSTSCRLTKLPANGFVQYLYSPGIYSKIDDMVPNLVKVKFTCIPSHRILGNDTIVCRDGIWDGDVPDCYPFCPPIMPSVVFSTNCSLNNVNVSCAEPAEAGTIATATCRYGYESSSPTPYQRTCGTDGRWEPEQLLCLQNCGELAIHNSSVKGTDTATLQAPWHVSIYKRLSVDQSFEPICGGSILTARVVISAAQCFWNEAKADFDDKSLFKIKTGKSFREYDDEKETAQVQSFSIYRLDNLIKFYGLQEKLKNNIIVAILESFVEYNRHTLPICFDHSLELEDAYVSPGRKGLLGVWNQNESVNEASSMLKVVELSVSTREECISNIPKGHIDFFTSDKYCAKRLSPDVTVRQGNSGSGLAFPVEKDGEIFYFLEGVATESPAKISGDLSNYSMFTNAYFFAEEISVSYFKFSPLEALDIPTYEYDEFTRECTITEIPADGFVSYLDVQDKSPSSLNYSRLNIGQAVPNFIPLRYGCDESFSLEGKQTNVCLNETWTNPVPKCSFNRGKLWLQASTYKNILKILIVVD